MAEFRLLQVPLPPLTMNQDPYHKRSPKIQNVKLYINLTTTTTGLQVPGLRQAHKFVAGFVLSLSLWAMYELSISYTRCSTQYLPGRLGHKVSDKSKLMNIKTFTCK